MKKHLYLFLLLMIVCHLCSYSQKPVVKLPTMVFVEGGSFLMGSDSGNVDEKPVHKVTISSFYIGKNEVTYAEFKRFVDSTGYKTDAEKPDSVRAFDGLPKREARTGTWNIYSTGIPVSKSDSLNPVGNISWYDAVAYCTWLSRISGKKFRLPTEAEWEFAAKGGVKSKGFIYAGGNNLDEVGWHLRNSRVRPHNIGLKTPNELDIHDMTGNNNEWCADWYGESYYIVSPVKDPGGSENGNYRVLRGGSWRSGESRMRISCRHYEFPFNCALGSGFRIVMSEGTK